MSVGGRGRVDRLLSRLARRGTRSTRSLERRVAYAPKNDRHADPGEVVWTWVEYEERDGRGKDRPVLVVGRSGRNLLTLMLSSNPARAGQRHWLTLGAGAWDGEDRPSWVRLDRVVVVRTSAVRRIGAILAWNRFEPVAARLRADYGWR